MPSINNSSPVTSSYNLSEFSDNEQDFDVVVDLSYIEKTPENERIVNFLFGTNCEGLCSFATLDDLVSNPNSVEIVHSDETEIYDLSLDPDNDRHDAALFVDYIEKNRSAYISPRELIEYQDGHWMLVLDLEDTNYEYLEYDSLIINIKKT